MALIRSLAMFLLILMSLLFEVRSIVAFPDVRPWIHSDSYMQRRLDDLSLAPFNHDYAGSSCNLDMDLTLENRPKGFQLRRKRVWIGRGHDVYTRATESMRNFSMIDRIGWARMVRGGYGDEKGARGMIASEVKCYNTFWSFNPSRFVCDKIAQCHASNGHLRRSRS